MESGSCLGPEVDCYSVDRITVRHNSVVSQRTFLCSASHDVSSADFALTSAAIEIGDSSWVAAEAFVGPGVTVGRRAVVLARAVVVRDVPDEVVVAGNPARITRSRSAVSGSPRSLM